MHERESRSARILDVINGSPENHFSNLVLQGNYQEGQTVQPIATFGLFSHGRHYYDCAGFCHTSTTTPVAMLGQVVKLVLPSGKENQPYPLNKALLRQSESRLERKNLPSVVLLIGRTSTDPEVIMLFCCPGFSFPVALSCLQSAAKARLHLLN